MDELTELVVDRKKDLPFTKGGERLRVRPMPLQLAMQVSAPREGENTIEVETDLMASIIARCVLMPDGQQAYTEAEVLDGDIDAMMPLFNAVVGAFGPEEAEKNS